MNVASISTAVGAGSDTKPKDLKEAAQAFEGMLLAEMLRAAREAGGSTLGGGEGDSASSAFVDHAESLLANHLAKAGGLGLSDTILKQLGGAVAASPSAQKEHSIGS